MPLTLVLVFVSQVFDATKLEYMRYRLKNGAPYKWNTAIKKIEQM